MRKLGLLLVLALSLAACQSQPGAVAKPTLPRPQVVVMTSTPGPAGGATLSPSFPTPAAMPTPAAPVSATVAAPDGAALATTFYAPLQTGSTASAKAPGVLLLPMANQERAEWDSLARALQQRGFAVLSMDLRGQGESAGPADWAKSSADVQAVWQALLVRPEVNADRSGMVGASVGANLALIVGEDNPNVATVIALSPGQDYYGLQPAGKLGNFGQRGVLMVASQDDAYAYDSVRQMAPLVPKGETYYFADAGHGIDMFGTPTLAPLLISWLEEHLGVLKG